MMLEHGNVLILDEPTNHLDLSSKEAIETALESYTGTIIFVSHDRYLLSKIADRIFELTENSCQIHECGFEKYLEIFKEREAEQRRIAETEKSAKIAENLKDRQEKSHRNKQQRSADAQRKAEMRRLESEIDGYQNIIDTLTEEISKEEVYTDYQLMNEKCTEIERLKNLIDEIFDRLVELDE